MFDSRMTLAILVLVVWISSPGGFTEQAAQAVRKPLSFISPLPIYLLMKKAANCMSLAALFMRYGLGLIELMP